MYVYSINTDQGLGYLTYVNSYTYVVLKGDLLRFMCHFIQPAFFVPPSLSPCRFRGCALKMPCKRDATDLQCNAIKQGSLALMAHFPSPYSLVTLPLSALTGKLLIFPVHGIIDETSP